ncbi:hypothetical protein EGW08_008112 [Elysia chlorotica]|uniref:Nuclear receptor domain-containing protein n=1 Tax=Elysia chlorotica TaxID=188477 RepID=A0A3S1C697_ELYCH|nr:hypothetical protein EGW08_008112 [Elysia chlorotica]
MSAIIVRQNQADAGGWRGAVAGLGDLYETFLYLFAQSDRGANNTRGFHTEATVPSQPPAANLKPACEERSQTKRYLKEFPRLWTSLRGKKRFSTEVNEFPATMPHGSIPFPFGNCRICDDKATGIHYGVATCEGCKGFFKRSLPKRDRFSCFFGGQCKITRFNRNRCKACRFKRCLDNGMAVEAVKMGRIPKMTKERALYEAHCTTGAPLGSEDDDSEQMVSGQCEGVPGYLDNSLTNDFFPTVATTQTETSSRQLLNRSYSERIFSTDPTSDQSTKYSGGLAMKGPSHTTNSDVRSSSYGDLRSDGTFHQFHRSFEKLGNGNSSRHTPSHKESNCARTFSNGHFLASCLPSAASVPSHIYSGQPANTWKDCQATSGYHGQSFQSHKSTAMNSFGTNRTTDPFNSSKSFRTACDEHIPKNNLQRSFSYEIKREVLELSENVQQQQNEQMFRGARQFANGGNQSAAQLPQICSNPNMSKSDFSNLIAPDIESKAPENALKKRPSRASEQDTVYCHNPFAQTPCEDSGSRSCQSIKSLATGAREISLEEKTSFIKPVLFNGFNSDDTCNTSMSNSSAMSTQCSQTRNIIMEPERFPYSSSSEFEGVEDRKSFDSVASASSGCSSSRRSAYSPDVVKVLLNQVGEERLRGLKQHLMTSIAPACGPEEFQAAVDLLRQYSEIPSPSSAASASCNSACGQPPALGGQFQASGPRAMDTPETGLFVSEKSLTLDPESTYTSGVFSGEESSNGQTQPAVNHDKYNIDENATIEQLVASDEGANQYGQNNSKSNIFENPSNGQVSLSQFTMDLPSPSHSTDMETFENTSCANKTDGLNEVAPPKSLAQRVLDSLSVTDRGETHVLPDQKYRSLLDPGMVPETLANGFPCREDSHSSSVSLPTNKASFKRRFRLLTLSSLRYKYTFPRETSLAGCPSTACNSSQGSNAEEMTMPELSLTLSAAFDTHMALFKFMYAQMQQILKGEVAMPVHPLIPEAKTIVYEQLIESIEAINKAIIGFCNCVPGLSTLPKSDKDYLTKRAYYDIWMLTNSRLFHEGQTYLRLPDGTYYTRDWMEVILNKQIVQVFFNFSVAFNSLALSNLEVAILCAIQLTSPGNESPGVCGLVYREKVDHINSQLVDLLVLEVGRNHARSGPRILVDIFRLLPGLAEINMLQQQIIGNFAADTVPENVDYSPKPAPLADLSEAQLKAVFNE